MIRPAEPADVPAILRLIHELADYEREPDAVRSSTADLAANLFPAGRDPLVGCLVAAVAGQVVGMAIWYVTYSTWEGRHGLYLEDLYVQPAHRGAGLGKALMSELAAEAVRRGYPRLDWSVLDWNTSARAFYTAIGGQPRSDWLPYRISEEALRRLAGADAAQD